MTRQCEKTLERYLVAAARTGGRRAAGHLVALRGPRLLAHARRLLGEAEVARDVVQEAWVEILRGLNGLRDDSAFLPWALQITSRRVAREIKRRQKVRQLDEAWAGQADLSTPADDGQGIDALKVRRAIAALPPAQRATVALFYLEDLRVAEVAQALDVPVGTVKTRLMHARAALRRALEGDEDVET